MTKEEAKLTLQENFGLLSFEYPGRITEALKIALEALSDPPLLSNLEEAADNYVGHSREIDESLSVYCEREAFKAGAEWMASQGAYFEDVIEMCYCNKKPMGLSGDNISITNEIQTLMQSHGIGDGDKVIIQIRKK